LTGNGCSKCKNVQCSERHLASQDDVIAKMIQVHGKKYNYSLVDYKRSDKKVKIICGKHGIFEQTPNNHIASKQGCPKCNESRGETEIRVWCENHNIPYISQACFDSCANTKTNFKLKFDFYLPEKKICIEFDGPQHYKEFIGKYRIRGFVLTMKKWLELSYRDDLKNQFCIKNNMKLLRISFKQNITEVLNDFFGTCETK